MTTLANIAPRIGAAQTEILAALDRLAAGRPDLAERLRLLRASHPNLFSGKDPTITSWAVAETLALLASAMADLDEARTRKAAR